MLKTELFSLHNVIFIIVVATLALFATHHFMGSTLELSKNNDDAINP